MKSSPLRHKINTFQTTHWPKSHSSLNGNLLVKDTYLENWEITALQTWLKNKGSARELGCSCSSKKQDCLSAIPSGESHLIMVLLQAGITASHKSLLGYYISQRRDSQSPLSERSRRWTTRSSCLLLMGKHILGEVSILAEFRFWDTRSWEHGFSQRQVLELTFQQNHFLAKQSPRKSGFPQSVVRKLPSTGARLSIKEDSINDLPTLQKSGLLRKQWRYCFEEKQSWWVSSTSIQVPAVSWYLLMFWMLSWP